jgi:hypothetical protein
VTTAKARPGALTPYQRFSLFLGGALVLGALALSFTIATIIERFVTDETAARSAREVEVHFPTIFSYGVFRGPLSPDENTRFNRTVPLHLDVYEVVGVQMYRRDGTVVYSYDPSVIGRSAFEGADAERARRAVDGAASHAVTVGAVARPPLAGAPPAPGSGLGDAAPPAGHAAHASAVATGDGPLGQVSHELRGPLAPIVGYAELLADQSAEPGQVQQFAGMIQDGATRLQRLVDDLLDLSRIENGRYSLERRPIALEPLLERSIHGLRHAATGHTFTLEVPPDLPPVDADPDRVAQVITNLVGNAVSYSPDGGEIGVRAEVRQRTVVVSVADRGIGIPADRLGQVFEKFYRVDKRVARTVGRTGLGLAISRELVQAHGGEIRVDSTPGQGSTFSFSLPLAPESVRSATRSGPEEAAA